MRAVQSDLLLDMTELMLDYATSSGQQITADVLRKKVESLKKKGNEQPTSGGKPIFAFDLHDRPKETDPTPTTAPAAPATAPATATTTDSNQTTESKIPAENQAKPSQVKAQSSKPSPDPMLLV